MSHLSQLQTDTKPQKQSSAKNSNFSASGSSSNANSNGVYVDLGKALLEAAKCGDTEKVQECIKNGAPFITDWVNIIVFCVSTTQFITSAFENEECFIHVYLSLSLVARDIGASLERQE
jgi:hypothetical protein